MLSAAWTKTAVASIRTTANGTLFFITGFFILLNDEFTGPRGGAVVGRVERLGGRFMSHNLIMIPGLNKIDSFMADHIYNAMLLSNSTRPYT
jgi:hypothetical protein